MKFVPVEKLPDIQTGKCTRTKSHVHKVYLQEFMNMNVKIARVEFGRNDFSDIRSAYRSLLQTITRSGDPIKVCFRDNSIYLVRRDI